MAKQDARKQFVQSRLKAIGGDATPEQKAKLRQRFNKLSETKEGRTRIAQVVLPSATAEQRKALKQSLRPTKTSTTSTVTSPTVTSPTVTGSKVDLTGVRDARPYRPTIISNGNTAQNNSQSSAVIPSNKIIVPGSTDSPRQDFANPVVNFLFKGLPGTDSWKAKGTGFKVEDSPLGVGGVAKGVKMIQGGNYVGGVGRTVLGVAEVGVSIISMLKGGRNQSLQTGANQTSLRTQNKQYQRDITKLQNQKFGEKQGLMGHTTPGGIRAESSVQALQGKLGGPTDYPVRSAPRAYPGESRWATDQASGATGPAFYERNNPVYGPALPTTPTKTPAKTRASKTPTATTVPKTTATTTPTATTVPKTTATTTPKTPVTTVPKTSTATTVLKKSSVTTVPTSVSPPSTAPRQYDPQGKGIGEPLDIRVGDPMPVKPAKPAGVSKVKFDMSDQMIDYEVRLANYYRYNKITPPKKK